MSTESEIVYKNIIQLCKYRGATVTGQILDVQGFRATLESQYYVQVSAERPASDIRGAAHIIVIQFSVHQFIESSMQKFRPFITKLIRAKPKDDVLYNIIFIACSPPKTAILRFINEVEAGVLIELYQTKKMLIVVPEHIYVPKHSIVPQEEVGQLMDNLHLVPQNLPCILASDPVAIWLGIRPGMIVRIERTIETAGVETTYRRCI